jgi:hypothetical protein
MDSEYMLDELVIYKDNVYIVKSIAYMDVLNTFIYGLVPMDQPELIEKLIVKESSLQIFKM